MTSSNKDGAYSGGLEYFRVLFLMEASDEHSFFERLVHQKPVYY